MIIGKLLEVYPATKRVFERHFGEDCFSCPELVSETIETSAMMHNVGLDSLIDDINKLIYNMFKK